MVEHIETIRAANRRIRGISILVGCECDILLDGSMDYPQEILEECDIVVASIHSGMVSGKVSPTSRLLKAIENRYVTIIGHATGRLLNRRPAMEVEMDQIARAAAQSGTALEINASWQRLDLKAVHARQAAEAGAMLVINTDSHHAEGFDQIRYGVMTARRAGVVAEGILNTRSLQGLRGWIGRKRGRRGA